jgi:predicted amidohydrolase YtcJ
VFTGNPAVPYAQAIAVAGERILAVGDDLSTRRLAASHTHLVDLQHRTVIPGIHDAHNHLGVWPAAAVRLSFPGDGPPWSAVAPVIAKVRPATQMP